MQIYYKICCSSVFFLNYTKRKNVIRLQQNTEYQSKRLKALNTLESQFIKSAVVAIIYTSLILNKEKLKSGVKHKCTSIKNQSI